MVDVISAISLAQGAYTALKKGIAVGKEIHTMSSQLSTWMSAVSDMIRRTKKQKTLPCSKKYLTQKQLNKRQLNYLPKKNN